MAEDPKSNSVQKDAKKKLKELGDKCKEVMGGPFAGPFGNERYLPQKTTEITKLAQPS